MPAALPHDERWFLAWRAAHDAGACRLVAADAADRAEPPPEGTHPCAPCTWFWERSWCADQDAPARARCADIEPRPEDDTRNRDAYAIIEGSAD